MGLQMWEKADGWKCIEEGRYGKGGAWQEEELNSVKPCGPIGPIHVLIAHGVHGFAELLGRLAVDEQMATLPESSLAVLPGLQLHGPQGIFLLLLLCIQHNINAD